MSEEYYDTVCDDAWSEVNESSLSIIKNWDDLSYSLGHIIRSSMSWPCLWTLRTIGTVFREGFMKNRRRALKWLRHRKHNQSTVWAKYSSPLNANNFCEIFPLSSSDTSINLTYIVYGIDTEWPKKCIHSLLINISGISYDSVWMPMVATSNTYTDSKI